VNSETIHCPACSSDKYEFQFAVRDRFETVPGQKYRIVRCADCGLLFVNPRPDAESISEFYEASGYDPFISSGGDRSAAAAAYRLVRYFSVRRKAARVIHGLSKDACVLDVGCATGEFAAELKRRGFRSCGAEPDGKAAEFARKQFGLTVWTGGIEAVPDPAGPFDLITMWHVLEHVHDLQGTLERLHGFLTPRGKLAVAVPNPMSTDARLYGTDWVAWDAPRHLYHFEPRVLLTLLDRAGFRSERAGAVAFDAFYHSLLSESESAWRGWRAGARGLRSFLRGVFGGEGSSELYIAYKR